MPTTNYGVRIPDAIERDAREAHPELIDAPVPTLVRIALMALAGVSVTEAIRRANDGMKPTGRPVGSKTRK